MGPTAANGHNLQGGLVGGKTEIILIISKVFWRGAFPALEGKTDDV